MCLDFWFCDFVLEFKVKWQKIYFFGCNTTCTSTIWGVKDGYAKRDLSEGLQDVRLSVWHGMLLLQQTSYMFDDRLTLAEHCQMY